MSSTEIVLDGTQDPDLDHRIFYIHPFGTSEVESLPEGIPFLPRYDNQGELYIVDNGGEVYKILPTLGIMEVSGDNGATPLTMDAQGNSIQPLRMPATRAAAVTC